MSFRRTRVAGRADAGRRTRFRKEGSTLIKHISMLVVASGATRSELEPEAPGGGEGTTGKPGGRTTPAPAAAAQVDRGDDEKAIRALFDAFVKAFNAGDAAAAAATYTETAIVVDEGASAPRARRHPRPVRRLVRRQSRQHDRHRGRLTPLPRSGHGARGRPHDDHPGRGAGPRDHPLHGRLRQAGRPLAPGRRPRRGRARRHSPRSPQGTGVARGRLGQREPGRGRLHHLQVGQRRQLPRSRVHHEDRGPARALGHPADRLGPAQRQFKTWIFDSEGGHGEGYWTRNGNQWVIKVEGVRQDGQPASATNIITRLGKDRMSWQSIAPDRGRRRGPRGRRVRRGSQAPRGRQVSGDPQS